MTKQGSGERVYKDWMTIMEDLLHGSRTAQQVAFVEIDDLISSLLVRVRALDHREEWDELRQNILEKLVKSFRRKQLRNSKAFVSYAETITRNTFYDFLKKQTDVPVEELPEIPHTDEPPDTDDVFAVRAAMNRLPQKWREAIQAVYLEGHTQEDAAKVKNIPLRSLKRYLQKGMAQLKDQLADVFIEGPSPGMQ